MNTFFEKFNEIANFKPENLNEFQQIIFWILVLAIIALWCFIDIMGFLLSAYLVKYTDIENKFPKLKKIINYYLKSNYLFIILQMIYIIFIYTFIIAMCLLLFYKG